MERTIDTELGPLAITDEGRGPALLLWPSLYLDRRSWGAVLPALTGERRCIVVDGPGHGSSPGPGRPYDLAACARAAVQLLDALGVAQADWAGNAWGGHVGVRAAVDHPARLRSLTVIASPMRPLSPKTRFQKRYLLDPMIRLGLTGLVGKLLAKAMLSPSAGPELHEHVRRSVREAPRAGLVEAVGSISIRRTDLVPELPRIACPTLWISGGDDTMYPPSVAAAEAALIPGARYVTLDGAAHLGPIERPHEVAGLIRSQWAGEAAAVRSA
jgi:pimeloyl-ACP methyl ester carboxylesterase